MSTEIKIEKVFASESDANDFFHESKRENPMYNLIRFTYLRGIGKVYFYLVTTSTLMTVVCESHDYLGMVSWCSRRECGFDLGDEGFFLVGVDLIDM